MPEAVEDVRPATQRPIKRQRRQGQGPGEGQVDDDSGADNDDEAMQAG
jgi:hypothetical protein